MFFWGDLLWDIFPIIRFHYKIDWFSLFSISLCAGMLF